MRVERQFPLPFRTPSCAIGDAWEPIGAVGLVQAVTVKAVRAMVTAASKS